MQESVVAPPKKKQKKKQSPRITIIFLQNYSIIPIKCEVKNDMPENIFYLCVAVNSPAIEFLFFYFDIKMLLLSNVNIVAGFLITT